MKKIKEYLKNKFNNEEKGSVMIEVMVATPVILFVVWGTVNIFMYLLATHQMNNAAYEVARAASMEMRGMSGTIESRGLHNDTFFRTNLRNKAYNVVSQNHSIRMFDDVEYEPIMILEDGLGLTDPKENCLNVIDEVDNTNVICAFVETTNDSEARDHEQVTVYMKSSFKTIGNYLPVWGGMFQIRGKGVVQKELTDNFRYVD